MTLDHALDLFGAAGGACTTAAYLWRRTAPLRLDARVALYRTAVLLGLADGPVAASPEPVAYAPAPRVPRVRVRHLSDARAPLAHRRHVVRHIRPQAGHAA